MKNRISCDSHDHFEIACMHQSDVTVTLTDGSIHIGTAFDIRSRNQTEYLILVTNSTKMELDLTKVHRFEYENNLVEIQ